MQTGNLDGQGLAELRGYKFQNLSSAPTTNLYEGRFYMNTSDHTLYVYNGTTFVDALSQGKVYLAGLGIDSTALANGTIAVSTTIASKTDIGNGALTVQRNGSAVGTFTANQTSASTINISVPTTASEVGALPDSTVIGDGATVFKKNGTAFATITANQTSTVNVNYTIPTSASDINAVPNSRTINGYTLTADVTLTAGDVGALPDSTTIGSANLTIKRNNTAIGTFSANATEAIAIDISVPTTATEVGALPSSTTITDLVSTTQMNAINSGITASGVTAIATNTSDIAAINSLIPSETSTSNQLADKAFVNSSISTATATFRGTFNSVAALEAYSGEKDDNDYAFVTGTDSDDNTYYDRYKYNGTAWVFEYRLNNSSFTSTQWAAINSGVTTATVSAVAANTTAIAGKQDTLTPGANIQINGNTISATDTIYTLPVAASNTLGGVKVGANLSIAADGTLAAVAEQITVDTTLSTSSTNPVQNKVVTSAIQSNTSAIAAKSSVTFVDWSM